MLAVNESERQNALAQALSDIIWNAGEENQAATVLLPPEDNSSKPIGASQVRLNDMTEDVRYHSSLFFVYYTTEYNIKYCKNKTLNLIRVSY